MTPMMSRVSIQIFFNLLASFVQVSIDPTGRPSTIDLFVPEVTPQELELGLDSRADQPVSE